ncbi:hypothetical protein BGX24_012497 [Mortierella sp. AD032]|nr:hypothetical protein BGX24_012497 [Mortierella sp. AD032]
MEVKKPNTTMDDIKDDTRKLPCVMKIALNMLIYGVYRMHYKNIIEVCAMKLERKAFYFPKSFVRFKLSQVRLSITSPSFDCSQEHHIRTNDLIVRDEFKTDSMCIYTIHKDQRCTEKHFAWALKP